jgi:aspartate/methionine/tyrosine aminotransferase
MVRACGATPVFVPTLASDGFAIDPRRVAAAITPRTRCLLVASPSNPTGAVQSAQVMRELAELGLPILSDEIYDGLLFGDAKVASPLGHCEHAFVFDGFSKRYAMTGYRLGYVIAPEPAMRARQSLQQNLHISASMFAQRAGLTALTTGAPYVQAMRDEYAKRREVLMMGVRALGFQVPCEPAGAFYVLADARHLGSSSMDIALDLLARAHVTVAPGRDFGAIAEGFLRFSYSTSLPRIEEGLSRLRAVL